MDSVVNGLLAIIEALRGYAIRISLPLFILVGIVLAIWFSFANEQNKQRIKIWYMVLIGAAILIIVIPVVLPWFQSFF